MAQGVLPFKYEAEKNRSGMTALAGLPTYVELASVCGLQASIARHIGVRRGTQGWSDTQVLMSLILLNLAGGDCVAKSARGVAPRAAYRSVRESLDSYGSCHSLKAVAFRYS